MSAISRHLHSHKPLTTSYINCCGSKRNSEHLSSCCSCCCCRCLLSWNVVRQQFVLNARRRKSHRCGDDKLTPATAELLRQHTKVSRQRQKTLLNRHHFTLSQFHRGTVYFHACVISAAVWTRRGSADCIYMGPWSSADCVIRAYGAAGPSGKRQSFGTIGLHYTILHCASQLAPLMKF